MTAIKHSLLLYFSVNYEILMQMVVRKAPLMVDICGKRQTLVSSDCPCFEYLLSLAGRAFRFCGGDYVNGAQWSGDEVDVTECVALSSQATRRLCQAVTVSQDLSAYDITITGIFFSESSQCYSPGSHGGGKYHFQLKRTDGC